MKVRLIVHTGLEILGLGFLSLVLNFCVGVDSSVVVDFFCCRGSKGFEDFGDFGFGFLSPF